MWAAMEAVSPTLIYDADAMGGETRVVPAETAAKISAPTLLLDGEATFAMYPFMRHSADALAKVMPKSQRRTLEGQSHDVSPEALAPVLTEFFAS